MGRGSVSSGDQYKSIAGKDDRREREREGGRERANRRLYTR